MDFCTKMAGELLHQEIEKDFNKNIVVSPLSFNAIVNMIAAGSAGPTQDQMLGFLESTNMHDINLRFSAFMAIAAATYDANSNGGGGGPVTCFVNGAWVSDRYPLKDSYQKLVKYVYKAEARNVDFAKVNEVVEAANAWAKSATKGLLTDVLKPHHINPTIKLILGNALYFKGSWQEPFDKQATTDFYFTLLNGDKIIAPFMTGCTAYSYESFDGFQVVKIPYKSGNDVLRKFCMYIFLPDETDGLQSLVRRFNSDPEFFNKHSRLGHRKVDVFWVPKFRFTYCSEEAPEMMKRMGLTLPFAEDCKDLTEMVSLQDGESLFLSNIIQKAFVEVDEEGTEAAAVTLACPAFGSSMYSEYQRTRFVADHPFIFFIREENSGLVFFTGAILNPISSTIV